MCDLPVSSEAADSLNVRLQSLQELTECTEKCQKQLDGLFEAFGWSNEMNVNSIQQDSLEVCPYDRNHRVPQKSIERHKAACRLSKMGYSREEQAGMYDPTICYEQTKVHSLVIDKATQEQIILKGKASAPIGRTEGLYCQSEYSSDPPDVPQNHKRSICDLTVADRLALYDHVIREANQQRAPAKPVENDDLYVDLVAKLKKDEEQNGPKSHLEVLAEMRDYKRRRQSYRAKNVHITKKTYTEVIREVIDVHSGELARLWEEEEAFRTSRHSSHRRRSEERRSVSVESRSSLSSSRRRRRRSRERSQDRDRDDRKQRDLHSTEERHHERKKRKRT
ncbi:U11/U12 small nuclear ribonucleoprotein 48 kDa protein isoform X1 [Anguilla anguilla]|uniref:U11/U12 small nuclear ribonucleoprotein 48 kDa protein isoform X1 n=1 Tax=Anguilla anguilla TaxID=7936 RepID=UPI0015AEE16E|nr:U11/U12 small nuclear ribonucleoprotein 48 kDa protein isoform X1 [Anguilla anguilla]